MIIHTSGTTNWPTFDRDATQFAVIRDLMLATSARGDWLTLAEIAEATEFGEASISAQLRHLRKVKFGHYRVEKRRRELLYASSPHTAGNVTPELGVDTGSDRRAGAVVTLTAIATASETLPATCDAAADSAANEDEDAQSALRSSVGCLAPLCESRRRAEPQGPLAPWEYCVFDMPASERAPFATLDVENSNADRSAKEAAVRCSSAEEVCDR